MRLYISILQHDSVCMVSNICVAGVCLSSSLITVSYIGILKHSDQEKLSAYEVDLIRLVMREVRLMLTFTSIDIIYNI